MPSDLEHASTLASFALNPLKQILRPRDRFSLSICFKFQIYRKWEGKPSRFISFDDVTNAIGLSSIHMEKLIALLRRLLPDPKMILQNSRGGSHPDALNVLFLSIR
jgi:hypothetical protein